MELLKFENLDLQNDFVEVLFDGILDEGFFVETDFSYDKSILEEPQETNHFVTTYEAINVYLWNFKIYNVNNEQISVNKRETKKIKQLIEFKLIDSINDYLNNN